MKYRLSLDNNSYKSAEYMEEFESDQEAIAWADGIFEDKKFADSGFLNSREEEEIEVEAYYGKRKVKREVNNKEIKEYNRDRKKEMEKLDELVENIHKAITKAEKYAEKNYMSFKINGIDYGYYDEDYGDESWVNSWC